MATEAHSRGRAGVGQAEGLEQQERLRTGGLVGHPTWEYAQGPSLLLLFPGGGVREAGTQTPALPQFWLRELRERLRVTQLPSNPLGQPTLPDLGSHFPVGSVSSAPSPSRGTQACPEPQGFFTQFAPPPSPRLPTSPATLVPGPTLALAWPAGPGHTQG